MGVIKYSLLGLTAMLFLGPVFGRQRILLLDKYFICKGCEVRSPKVSKKQIASDIEKETTLLEARDRIIGYFSTVGDQFALHCPSCKKQAFYTYVHGTQSRSFRQKGFGTDINLRPGGNQKGGDDIYQIADVVAFLTDTVLVFDSLRLSTASVVARDQPLLGHFSVSYRVGGRVIERAIPYDPKQELLTLSYASLFGKPLSRAVTDTLPIALHYYTPDRQKVTAPGTFKVFFASEEEKKDLVNWVNLCRKEFPDWTPKQTAQALYSLLIAKYNNASLPNFIQWLSKSGSNR